MSNSNKSQKKNQKSQGPKRSKDIRIPVEPQIPQCEVCEEKKADFYCTECKVHYCQNCESEVHTSSWKKKHEEFIFQEPYVPREIKKTIKLIRESNEIIEKDEEESGKERKKEQQSKREIQREKEKSEEIRRLNQREIQRLEEEKREKILEIERREREEYEEEFDPKFNLQNLIELKNENKTAWNPTFRYGTICGKKIYSRGKHQIKIKIDQFPKPENIENNIYLGVIKTENREESNKKVQWNNWEKTYCFNGSWNGKRSGSHRQNECLKVKKENKLGSSKKYPIGIYLKKNDIFEILLDMDQKKISFKLNEKELEGWENIPEKVNLFVCLSTIKGKEKNQITILKKLEKVKKTIKLIRESNEIIEKDEEESGKERKKEQQSKREIQRLEEEKMEKILEEFDPKMNLENRIELKNENKTAWNPIEDNGIICGKKIYSRGKHEIKIKINQFQKPKMYVNGIVLGVVKPERREFLIDNTQYRSYDKTYFIESFWNGWENLFQKGKQENGKTIIEKYPKGTFFKKMYFRKNDIITILLDMDQKKISFKLNKKKLEGWENIPEKVSFYACMKWTIKGKKNNQITII
ncbi:spry domain containing socs box protein [Anaeramoeba flamelloides]|uniref:Spry domain containing socs box protein n=1 Tax=Anaeramoeba flamelloides TaxID=1746091 RepID=A0ABQ8XZP1_9EUKA|nr:spry domain containing socs box protein [Anaeramoeba flamelloides]